MRFALSHAIADLHISAIAEFKRRSPSMGDIRPDARVEDMIPAYERGGASAISILVDERFGGTIDDLRAARAATQLPLLAKGFFTTEKQVRELREAGADAVLLILRDLDDPTAERLSDYVFGLGLDALVEAHDQDETQRAVRLRGIVGVNARDLSNFAIDRKEQLRLIAPLRSEAVVVAESAIHSRAQAAEAQLAGANAVLVGTALMQALDPEAKLRELISRPLVKVCGLTRQEDVDAAVEAGADMLGFVFAEGSPRRAPAVLDVPDTALSVAVSVGNAEDRGADLYQVYEPEPGNVRGRRAWLRSPNGGHAAYVADLPWEGGDLEDHWREARKMRRRPFLMLAGGLGPENVRKAVEMFSARGQHVSPWAVDASSSLESAPGIKDHAKVRAFVEAARG